MVKVDKETCIGCGSCESLCPKIFEIKDLKAKVKKGQEKSKDKCIKEVIDICPVDAVKP